MKPIKKSLVCLALTTCFMCYATAALASSCYCRATSLESTQLKNKFELVKQLQEQVKIVSAQMRMIEKLSGQMSSKLNGANSMILGQFDRLIRTWQDAMSLTHATDDFMEKHRERHPGYVPGGDFNYQAENNRRDTEWKKMVEAYLKGINLTALDLADAHKTRQTMYNVLQSAEGQVQALQALGAMINHTSMILERNGQLVAAQTVMFAENETDSREKAAAVDASLEASFKGMKEAENEAPPFKLVPMESIR